MRKNNTIGTNLFLRNVIISAVLLVLLCVSFFGILYTNKLMLTSYQQQYISYLLADELRQSSDDLTKLARTHVITQDTGYKDQYQKILDIRGGQSARPQDYHRIYWDFVAANGQPPRADSNQTIDLIDLMKQNGFTAEELTKLDEAKKNSENLVNIEVEAMDLVKNEPSREISDRAIAIMHDGRYHSEKAKIMRPIDDFYQMMEERTNTAIQQAVTLSNMVAIVFGILCLLLMLMLWKTYRSLHHVLGGSVSELHDHITRMSNGNFSVKIPTVAHTDNLMKSLSDMQTRLGQLISRIHAASTELTSQAETINGAATQALGFANEQAQSTATMSASLEQLVVSINQASENTDIAKSVALNTEATFDHGGEIIKKTVHSIELIATRVHEGAQKVEDLNSYTQQVNAIVSMIKEIADQTNLLALNAAIEAARAGEQGRGFAVVADEVRKLAERTTLLTQDIIQSIGKIQHSTEQSAQSMITGVSSVNDGVNLANQAGKSLEDIRTSADQIINSINDISHMLKEQAIAANHVATNVEQVSQRADDSSRRVGEVFSAVEKLQQLAKELEQDISHFNF